MAIRTLVRFPDPRLRLPARTITAFDPALSALAEDLLDTMRAAPGIGITANHIGVAERLTVIELEDGIVRIYVNPRVTWSSAEPIVHPEGSVSMPGVTEDVTRARAVRITYQDLDGVTREAEVEGLLAVCLQHEVDQLDGIFWLQRLSRLKRERAIKRFEKLERERR
ncbi:peptide deformylase [Pararhizobium capsulatum DSM 1112]|uniref:Peptide deformylase-like n=1 Tax=Pararhizobium capsulatum DSM 1112 TaxID=1121113 RepID=A0ABU0BP78_9HYPH|nr:peptide deformylase [Pararhizobium capsulatum]MDQ0320051.1 peptide deformylase [Pararhizobium capsulatum DSM 1112]